MRAATWVARVAAGQGCEGRQPPTGPLRALPLHLRGPALCRTGASWRTHCATYTLYSVCCLGCVCWAGRAGGAEALGPPVWLWCTPARCARAASCPRCGAWAPNVRLWCNTAVPATCDGRCHGISGALMRRRVLGRVELVWCTHASWVGCVCACPRASLVCGRQPGGLAQPRAASPLALCLGTWTALCPQLAAILAACSPSPGESPTPRG